MANYKLSIVAFTFLSLFGCNEQSKSSPEPKAVEPTGLVKQQEEVVSQEGTMVIKDIELPSESSPVVSGAKQIDVEMMASDLSALKLESGRKFAKELKNVGGKFMEAGLLTGTLEVAKSLEPKFGLKVVLKVTNDTKLAVPLQFSSSKVGDIAIIDIGGAEVWRWSSDMMFTQALVETSLDSGTGTTYEFYIPESTLSQLHGTRYQLKASFEGKVVELGTKAMASFVVPFEYEHQKR